MTIYISWGIRVNLVEDDVCVYLKHITTNPVCEISEKQLATKKTFSNVLRSDRD